MKIKNMKWPTPPFFTDELSLNDIKIQYAKNPSETSIEIMKFQKIVLHFNTQLLLFSTNSNSFHFCALTITNLNNFNNNKMPNSWADI